MKKNIIILVSILSISGIITAQDLSVFNTVKKHSSKITTNTTADSSEREITTLTQFTDRVAFQNAYSGTLAFEDFFGNYNQGDLPNCGPIISSAGDGCYLPGELVDGFTITAKNLNGEPTGVTTVFAASPSLTQMVGGITFAGITILSFTPNPAYAVGFDFFLNSIPVGMARIYNADGILIDTIQVELINNTDTFFGIISDNEPIGKIELEAATSNYELIGKLEFGTELLGVNDNALAGFSYFPNPANTTINLKAIENIESVSIYNLLGQSVISKNINAVTSQVNISELATGTYIMKVSINGETGTYKVIKK